MTKQAVKLARLLQPVKKPKATKTKGRRKKKFDPADFTFKSLPVVPLSFVPRSEFKPTESLPRSYFLGHHAAGLEKMKSKLSSINLVIECRDYRIPITSRNPLFEQSLEGKDRIIVYTKRDLGSKDEETDTLREKIIRRWHPHADVLFSAYRLKPDIKAILAVIREHAMRANNIAGFHMLIVGMPNVGKSCLLNSLRQRGINGQKAARTGAQPGVTRSLSTRVKIAELHEGKEAIYVLDTPGVFMPYVPNAEAMLKLALCGMVKDTIISPVTLADYLLYHLNLYWPIVYSKYHPPTNDIMQLLDAVARKTGRLQKGAVPDTEAAALWLIQQWRLGEFGKFILDDLTTDLSVAEIEGALESAQSLSQARKEEKTRRRERIMARGTKRQTH